MANTSPRGNNLDHLPKNSYSTSHTSSSSREGGKSDADLNRHETLKGPQQKNPPGGTQSDDDLERANTPAVLYNIRSKPKQQDDSSLRRPRKRLNALGLLVLRSFVVFFDKGLLALQHYKRVKALGLLLLQLFIVFFTIRLLVMYPFEVFFAMGLLVVQYYKKNTKQPSGLTIDRIENVQRNRYSLPGISLERYDGIIQGDHLVKPTPIAGRFSRAKKGVLHTCDIYQPPKPSKDLHGDHASITQPPIHLTRHPAGICEESTNLPSVNDKLSSKDLHSGQISDTNIQSPSRTKQRSQRYLTHIRLLLWIKKLLRPRLKPGYRRIEWTCDCGVELYGDFMIDQVSALDGLELSLRMPAENTSQSSSSDSEKSVERGTNPRHMISRSISSSTRTALSTSSTDASSIDSAESKYLALCINTGSIYKTLAELDMSRLNSDGEAFSQMKKAYIQHRSVRSRLRFLINPVTVEFVRFTLWNLRRGYVSISDRPSSMPPNTRIDYDFVPPPMPPEVFVHYLEHGDGDLSPNRYTWLPRLPKRLNNKVMDCGEATEGWGIHVIEGPNREAVFWVLMITISASVLASVLWTTLKGDIQGGTGLGALIIALPPAIMAAFLFRLGAT